MSSDLRITSLFIYINEIGTRSQETRHVFNYHLLFWGKIPTKTKTRTLLIPKIKITLNTCLRV